MMIVVLFTTICVVLCVMAWLGYEIVTRFAEIEEDIADMKALLKRQDEDIAELKYRCDTWEKTLIRRLKNDSKSRARRAGGSIPRN